MRVICGAMQRVALVAPPISIVLNLAEVISLGQMLVMLVFAVCLFWIGRLLEGYLGSP